MFGVPCGYEWKDKYKDTPQVRTITMDLGIHIFWLGTPGPSGVNRIYLVGVV
jgi:hypothetical protein